MDAARRQCAEVWAALEWRPEWPFAVVVLAAWVALAAGTPGYHVRVDETSFAATQKSAPGHPGHRALGSPRPGAGLGPPAAPADGLRPLAEWGLMSVAMMLPVTLPAVRHVSVNSLRQRRHRAMAIYVAVYLGIWVGFGAGALVIVHWLRDAMGVDPRGLLASSLVVAAAWQVTRSKRRAIFQCRRTVPLPPIGHRADAGCVRFASLQAWRCIRSCWALMVVMAIVGHAGLLLMGAMTGLIALEELTRIGRRLLRASAGILAAAAGLVAIGV